MRWRANKKDTAEQYKVLQYFKKESTESLEGEKNTEKFCATEQNKKHCRTIKSGTADKKWYILQYSKKESTEHLEGIKTT